MREFRTSGSVRGAGRKLPRLLDQKTKLLKLKPQLAPVTHYHQKIRIKKQQGIQKVMAAMAKTSTIVLTAFILPTKNSSQETNALCA